MVTQQQALHPEVSTEVLERKADSYRCADRRANCNRITTVIALLPVTKDRDWTLHTIIIRYSVPAQARNANRKKYGGKKEKENGEVNGSGGGQHRSH